MPESLEDIAVRFAALNSRRWSDMDDQAKGYYRHLAAVEIERRKRKADEKDIPRKMPPWLRS